MKGKIVIDNKLCKGCGFCVTACPKGLIVSNNDSGVVYHADAEKCNGCGLCAVICPDIAIEVWREDGSTGTSSEPQPNSSPSRGHSAEQFDPELTAEGLSRSPKSRENYGSTGSPYYGTKKS